MIRQQINKHIPNDLPAARLFLDDIEELTAIINEAAEKTWQKNKPFRELSKNAGAPVSNERDQVQYMVGESSCDSIDDLRTLGGKHGEFRIETSGGGSVSLAQYGTRLTLSYEIDEATKWALYGQILAVFQRRPRRIRATFQGIPSWLDMIMLPVVGVAPMIIIPYLFKPYGPHVYVPATVIGYGSLGTFLYKTFLTHSVVELRYAHEAASLRHKWAAMKPYVLLGIGAMLYAFAERLMKAIWP